MVTRNAEASSSTGPHRMRITSGGCVKTYVSFAIGFLQENPGRALVLHTQPPSPSEASPQPASTSTNSKAKSKQPKRSSTSAPSTLSPSLLATPKLVSVAEKIKRDYLVSLDGKAHSQLAGSAAGGAKDKGIGKGKGKESEEQLGEPSGQSRGSGIWQYTESGLLPPLDIGEGEDVNTQGGAMSLEQVLQGKTKPKMLHRPYLQITLSTRPLGLEEAPKGRNVSCQYVIKRRRKGKGRKGKGKGKGKGLVGDADSKLLEAEGEGEEEGQVGLDGTAERGMIEQREAAGQPGGTRRAGRLDHPATAADPAATGGVAKGGEPTGPGVTAGSKRKSLSSSQSRQDDTTTKKRKKQGNVKS